MKDAINPDITFASLKAAIEKSWTPSRERSLALTKLEEAELWLTRAEPVKVEPVKPAIKYEYRAMRNSLYEPGNAHIILGGRTDDLDEARRRARVWGNCAWVERSPVGRDEWERVR